MNRTIDMVFMRYLNLFSKVTGVRTQNCFAYNRGLVYAVPSGFIAKAIGENGSNVKRISSILAMPVKIVEIPKNINDAQKFISKIVEPVSFDSLEITPNEIIISGNRQSKAILIGRNKSRFEELNEIVKDVFGKNLKIA